MTQTCYLRLAKPRFQCPFGVPLTNAPRKSASVYRLFRFVTECSGRLTDQPVGQGLLTMTQKANTLP